jgi:cation transport ATPase
LGPALVFLGIFGGGLLWIVLIGLRFDYLINEVYDGDPGEAIWSLDPLFTMLAAIPGVVLVFAGLILTAQSTSWLSEEVKPKTSYQQLNLVYLAEICLLITIVTSFIGFLGTSSIAVEEVRVSALIMSAIFITCLAHMFSFFLRGSISRLNSSRLSRNTAILIALELVALFSVVFTLRLYTWSFIRSITLVITSSGLLGLLLLTPRFLSIKSKDAAEGDI